MILTGLHVHSLVFTSAFISSFVGPVFNCSGPQLWLDVCLLQASQPCPLPGLPILAKIQPSHFSIIFSCRYGLLKCFTVVNFESMITFPCQTTTIVVIVATFLQHHLFSADWYITLLLLLLVEATEVLSELCELLVGT